ncbi:MAG: hypothetical protein CMJ48_14895 [Planctomycetaceae bacterium]|nr:hypothetical protein [Planctomycetaceae bacterium]
MQSDTPLISKDAVDSDSAASSVELLEERLAEKDKLVGALTKRLEQAAEQLDRIHRTGGDKALRTNAGGFPPELVDEQKSLVEDLQSAVDQWMDAQPTATLTRIEMQITELRTLVASGASGTAVGTLVGAVGAEHLPAEQSDAAPEQPVAPNASGEEQDLTSWEALKANILSGEEGATLADVPAPPPQPAAETQQDAPDAPSLPTTTIALTDIPELPETPPEIDLDTAQVDELRTAVEQRDAYIATVIKRLRVAEARHVQPVDWDNVQEAPDELRSCLEELQSQLKETLRVAEVELAIERARLGRKESELRQLEESVHKKMHEVGMDVERNDHASGDDRATTGKSRGWLGMLGLQDDN